MLQSDSTIFALEQVASRCDPNSSVDVGTVKCYELQRLELRVPCLPFCACGWRVHGYEDECLWVMGR
jgi:hypothetical protein